MSLRHMPPRGRVGIQSPSPTYAEHLLASMALTDRFGRVGKVLRKGLETRASVEWLQERRKQLVDLVSRDSEVVLEMKNEVQYLRRVVDSLLTELEKGDVARVANIDFLKQRVKEEEAKVLIFERSLEGIEDEAQKAKVSRELLEAELAAATQRVADLEASLAELEEAKRKAEEEASDTVDEMLATLRVKEEDLQKAKLAEEDLKQKLDLEQRAFEQVDERLKQLAADKVRVAYRPLKQTTALRAFPPCCQMTCSVCVVVPKNTGRDRGGSTRLE